MITTFPAMTKQGLLWLATSEASPLAPWQDKSHLPEVAAYYRRAIADDIPTSMELNKSMQAMSSFETILGRQARAITDAAPLTSMAGKALEKAAHFLALEAVTLFARRCAAILHPQHPAKQRLYQGLLDNIHTAIYWKTVGRGFEHRNAYQRGSLAKIAAATRLAIN